MFTNEEADEEEVAKDPLDGLDMAFVADSKKIYDNLCAQITITMGKAASKRERDEKKLKSTALVYGEITFETMGIIIEKIRKKYGKPYVGTSGATGLLQGSSGGIFYDLGSGSGKATVAAAILYNFDTCCGIEVLESLFSLSLDISAVYETKGKAKLLGRDVPTTVEFVNCDLVNVVQKDWRDGDVIFCNSTCFDDVLMNKLCDRCMMLEKGSFVITVTKRLPSAQDFIVLEYEMFPMTWGQATIYIHQKTTEAHQPKTIDSDEEEDDD